MFESSRTYNDEIPRNSYDSAEFTSTETARLLTLIDLIAEATGPPAHQHHSSTHPFIHYLSRFHGGCPCIATPATQQGCDLWHSLGNQQRFWTLICYLFKTCIWNMKRFPLLSLMTQGFQSCDMWHWLCTPLMPAPVNMKKTRINLLAWFLPSTKTQTHTNIIVAHLLVRICWKWELGIKRAPNINSQYSEK